MVTPGGRERKPITVLFADIVDSTGMAEEVDPEDWSSILNGAFDLMAEAVGRYGGTVSQFLGDGILAFFGAPIAHEDDPQRAVWAALAMLEAAEELSVRLQGEGRPPLRIRIGINTGPVILGHVGNAASGVYSAVGDTLNTAARVQAVAEPSSVAVTDRTFRLVSATFDGRDLGEIKVKGRTAPVHCYQIRGRRRADGPPDRSAGPPLIGRAGEIAKLERLVSAVERGRGGIAFVVGEPGIGKSRLIRELQSSASAGHPGLQWLEGRAESYGSSVPYGVVVQLVRSALGTGVGTGARQAAEAIARLLREAAGEQASSVYPYLAHLLSIDDPGASLPDGIEPELLQSRYVDSLTLLLGSMARLRPIVVVCEDLHWADASSAALLSRLMTTLAHARILFLFSTRRDQQSAGWRLLPQARETFGEALTEMKLEPFSPSESAALAAQLLGDAPPGSLSRSLFDVTEGNPLFIEEVVRTYASSSGRGWSAVPGLVLEGSYSLQSLMLSSIDRLPEDARRTLKVASVIGRDFSVDLLRHVLDNSGESFDLAPRLGALESSGVVTVSDVSPELRYSFRHALLQEAAYGSLLKSERKSLHEAVGAALESLYPESATELAGLLARHFGEAGDEKRSLAYSLQAADSAFARYAMPEAAVHYARAAELLSKSEHHRGDAATVFLRLGRALELTDRYDEAVETYRRLEELGRTKGARNVELAGLVAGATALVTPAGRQDIAEAERLAWRALEIARQTGDRVAESRSLWNLMLAHNFSGRNPAASVRFGEQALGIARELGGPEQVASTLLDLHWAYLGDGRMDLSFRALEEATVLWRQTGDKAMLADCLACSSGLKLFIGDFGGVVADAEQACLLSEQTGSLWGQSFARLYVGYALHEMGRTAQAIETMRECVRLASESITIAGQALTGADLGFVLVQSGHAEEGLAVARRAWELSHQGSGAYKVWAASTLARAHLLLGGVEDALFLLKQVDGERDTELFMPLPARFPLGLARTEVALAVGEAERALELSRYVVRELDRLHFKYWLPETLLLQAKACIALGRTQEAFEVLERGRSVARALGSPERLRHLDSVLLELRQKPL